MKSHDLTALVQFIRDRTGLKLSGQQMISLQRYVEAKVKALRLSSIDDYYALLRTVPSEQKNWQRENIGIQEWKQLITQLTVGESYFFRDTKQFELLKTRILPELIQRKRQLAIAPTASSPHPRPSLRLWSAGCSTGEEVYSLAVVLQEMIPDWSSWDIQVIGTDINAIAIEKAQAGLYPDWSFRHTQPEVRPQHLLRTAKGWQVSQVLKQIVRFYPLNLVSDVVPNPQLNLHDVDFIICRNVFIYFHADAIAHVLRKFYAALAPLGYLMTGHTELQGITTQPFQICCFPESILYQRSPNETGQNGRSSAAYPAMNAPAHTAIDPQINAPVRQRLASREQANLPQLRSPLSSALVSIVSPQAETDAPLVERPPKALLRAEMKPQSSPLSQSQEAAYYTYMQVAEAHANLGRYAEALSACQQAIQLQPLRVEPLYLLAHLAEENGDTEQAKTLLKKIIYLDPKAVAAYLELMIIYRRQGDVKRATKQLHHALILLSTMPESDQIPGYSYATVGEARQYLQQIKMASH